MTIRVDPASRGLADARPRPLGLSAPDGGAPAGAARRRRLRVLLLQALPRSRELGEAELDLIVAGAEGNPLYLEELVNAFADSAGLRRGADVGADRHRPEGPDADAREPPARAGSTRCPRSATAARTARRGDRAELPAPRAGARLGLRRHRARSDGARCARTSSASCAATRSPSTSSGTACSGRRASRRSRRLAGAPSTAQSQPRSRRCSRPRSTITSRSSPTTTRAATTWRRRSTTSSAPASARRPSTRGQRRGALGAGAEGRAEGRRHVGDRARPDAPGGAGGSRLEGAGIGVMPPARIEQLASSPFRSSHHQPRHRLAGLETQLGRDDLRPQTRIRQHALDVRARMAVTPVRTDGVVGAA